MLSISGFAAQQNPLSTPRFVLTRHDASCGDAGQARDLLVGRLLRKYLSRLLSLRQRFLEGNFRHAKTRRHAMLINFHRQFFHVSKNLAKRFLWKLTYDIHQYNFCLQLIY